MEINLKNIEQQIFFDEKICEKLPEFRHLFDQWRMSKQYPGFGNLGNRSVLDLLNSLEPKHIAILEEYFKTSILLNKIDPHIVRHHENGLNTEGLCEFSGYKEFCIYRSKDKMKLSFWR
jgi:hypothetical protein